MKSAACMVMVLLIATGAWAQSVTQIDLTQVEGDVLSITDGQVNVSVVEKIIDVSLADASEIRLTDTATPDIWRETGKQFLQTARGDVVGFTWLVFAGNELTVTTELLGEQALALADLRAAYLPGAEQTGASLVVEAEQLGVATGTTDRLLVQEEDRLLAVEGVLESVDLTERELLAPELTF